MTIDELLDVMDDTLEEATNLPFTGGKRVVDVEKVREIIDFDSDEDGYMPLSQIGIMLGRLYADFDSRNYGFSKLHKLIEHTGAFETKYEQLENGSKNLVVRNK